MSGLRVKDIFLDPKDFDPRQTIEPYPISREKETWTRSLSPDEFKSFWHQERIAFQFEHRSEGGCIRAIPTDKPDYMLPIYQKQRGSVGRPKTNDWSFMFRCRRYRPGKVLVIDRSSIGTACPVYIRMTKVVGRDEVQVEYQWRHNHNDSAEARANIPMGRNELIWIKLMVAEGLDWKSIRARLRLDKSSLQK
ncbi:hypothetical protein BGZ82_000305, partial [Podila clonocystis]